MDFVNKALDAIGANIPAIRPNAAQIPVAVALIIVGYTSGV